MTPTFGRNIMIPVISMSLITSTSLFLDFFLFFLFLFPLFSFHSPSCFHLLPPVSPHLLCIVPVSCVSATPSVLPPLSHLVPSYLPHLFSPIPPVHLLTLPAVCFLSLQLSTSLPALHNSTLFLFCKDPVQWDHQVFIRKKL